MVANCAFIAFALSTADVDDGVAALDDLLL